MALKGKYEQSHVVVKVIQWLGCTMVLSIIAAGGMVLFEQPFSVSALKWIQFLQSTAMFLLPPLCMAYLWSKKPLEWLKIRRKGDEARVNWQLTIGAILLMLVALPAINLLGDWNKQMSLPAFLEPMEQWMKTSEENAKLLTEQFLHVTTFGGLIINVLLMAVLPAVSEELTFRGILQNLFTPTNNNSSPMGRLGRGTHLAIWVTAIFFSAIHMQFYGFIPRMLMGALFGYVLVWTGSLWVPILMHLTNNAMAVIIYFVALRQGWDLEQMDAIGTGDTLWLGIASIVITIVGIYAFRRSTTMSKASSRMSSGS